MNVQYVNSKLCPFYKNFKQLEYEIWANISFFDFMRINVYKQHV